MEGIPRKLMEKQARVDNRRQLWRLLRVSECDTHEAYTTNTSATRSDAQDVAVIGQIMRSLTASLRKGRDGNLARSTCVQT